MDKLDQDALDKIYNRNKILDKDVKNRGQQIGPLPMNYWEDKPVGKQPRKTTLYRKERSIPEEGRPYVPIKIANYLTGYSVSFIKELYLDNTLRGFRFPKCVTMISLYDVYVYIDNLSSFEIDGMDVSPGLLRRIKKAKRIKRERNLLTDNAEYKEKFEDGDASQRRLIRRRKGVKRQLRRKDGTLV